MNARNHVGVTPDLLSKDQARRVAETVLDLISADDAVFNLDHRQRGTTRFSNNAIAQGMHQDRMTASLTVAFGNRLGTASVDSTDDDDLRKLVHRAEEIARLTPPDPEHLPSLGPQEYPTVDAFFEPTARFTEEDAARTVRGIIGPASAAGFRASGTVETLVAATTVATRNGLFAYHRGTKAEIGCTVTAADSSGWARDTAADCSRIDSARLVATAIDLARRSAAPEAIPPGRYTVLFMPPAAARLALPAVGNANARLTLEGLTYLSGRVGAKLAGDDITLYSDPGSPDIPCAPFDDDGVPRDRMTWVDQGIFSGMMWDRWTAHANGVLPVPWPGNLCMDGTDTPLENLIAGIDRGLLVTHVWYVRSVKMDQTLVTGMTRDGTFRIEGGKVVGPVRNLRFNDTSLGLLQRTVAIGRPERCISQETLPSLFPPLVVEGWNFVGVTEF